MIRPEVTMGEIPSSIRVPGGRCSRLSVEYLEFFLERNSGIKWLHLRLQRTVTYVPLGTVYHPPTELARELQ